ncbi:hypothetical protein CDV31_012033 [Fusarium ambrosium]|uniref:Uncharacterized protein n=1 Tax=Fusarium ambrosium TaxID=131363 RepID=A0A428TCL1_9HYPO|nr:hypothetical protein CDV31_012033 [Fusarium ambrosium]
MAEDHDATEPAGTEPVVSIQIEPGKQRLVLPFKDENEATTYFNLIKDEADLAPKRSGLLVSLDLVNADTIILCKRADDDLEIRFKTRNASKDWIRRSKLADRYHRRGKSVYIRRVKRSESEETDPSPPKPITVIIKRAETFLSRKSSQSEAPKEPMAPGTSFSRPVK